LVRLQSVFVNNGYPEQVITSTFNRIREDHVAKEQKMLIDEDMNEVDEIDYRDAFVAPYHPCARKMFQTLKKSFGIHTVHKKTPTLGTYLFKRRPKADFWDSKNVVYSVPCNDCLGQYIGQTKRKLCVRLSEHEKSCKGDLSHLEPNSNFDNGIPYHVATTGHEFGFEETKIVDREINRFRRRLLEGIHIQKNKDSVINIISGQKIDGCWKPLIQEIEL
jgi:hypothetical protein